MGCSSSCWPTGVALTINVASLSARFAFFSTRATSGNRSASASALAAFRATIVAVAPGHASPRQGRRRRRHRRQRVRYELLTALRPSSPGRRVESTHIGIVAVKSAGFEPERIDGTRAQGEIGKVVAAIVHGHLVRNGHVPGGRYFLRSRNIGPSLGPRTSSASYTRGIAAAWRAAF